MHARMISGLINPDKREETIGIFRDDIIPRAKAQDGFKGSLLLADFKTNRFHSITLWETEEDMSEGESSMYLNEQIGSVVSRFAGQPTIERFEVVFSLSDLGRGKALGF